MRIESPAPVIAALIVTAGGILTTAPAVHAGLTAEQQCQKARYFAAAKYDLCQRKIMGLFFADGDSAKMNVALSKCRVKYTDTWPKLQRKALGTGSTCDAPRFVDTGREEVQDNLTGLIWEKKDELGNSHDRLHTYNWLNAYLIFLAGADALGLFRGLNELGSCFNDCVWRLPTLAELQTILSEPFPCTTNPCIDPLFGPTASADHWSSTVVATSVIHAWGVFFVSGEVSFGHTFLVENAVRAVRGGL